MKLKTGLVTVMVLAAAVSTPAFMAASDSVDDPRAREIVKQMDELYRSNSSEATMEMVITTPHWKRTLKVRSWSRGSKHTFLRILEPQKERGMATLRMENEIWNYLPKTNKVMKVPPSMMMGAWMGSDFTNDDLVKEFTFLEDYRFAMTDVEDPQPGELYVRCVPKPDLPIVWGHIITAVREKGYLPLWQKFYDEKGTLMREITFSEEKTFGKRTIPAVMTLIPIRKKGRSTVVRYLDARFNIPIPKSTFSLRNLRTRI